MYVKPTAPLRIGQVLDGSFRLFGATWKKVWFFALGGAVIGSIGDIYQLVAPDIQLVWLFLALAILGGLLSTVFYSAIYLRQEAIASGVPIGGEMGVAARRLPRLILMTLATTLVVGAAAIPMGIVFGIANALDWPMWAKILGPLVLFSLPLIMLASLMFGSVALLVENRGPVESLKLSHSLVRGHWWRTALMASVGIIIIVVCYAVVAAVAGGLAAVVLAGLVTGQEAALLTLVSTVIAVVLVSVVATPYFIALMLAMYHDLKLRKEGGDLAQRLDSLA